MRYVWASHRNKADHDAICAWVSQKSFGHPNNLWPDSTSCGILDGEKPIAGFVFHDFKPGAGTIQLSGAAIDSRWVLGPSLHYIYSYIFDDLGCQMAMTGNSEKNTSLHRLLSAIGHRRHIIERGWDRETSLYFWTLTREEWESNTVMLRARKSAERLENVKFAQTHAA